MVFVSYPDGGLGAAFLAIYYGASTRWSQSWGWRRRLPGSPNPEARPDGMLCRCAPALILEPRQWHTARSVASRVLTGPVVVVDGLAVKRQTGAHHGHVLRGWEAVKKDFSHPGRRTAASTGKPDQADDFLQVVRAIRQVPHGCCGYLVPGTSAAGAPVGQGALGRVGRGSSCCRGSSDGTALGE